MGGGGDELGSAGWLVCSQSGAAPTSRPAVPWVEREVERATSSLREARRVKRRPSGPAVGEGGCGTGRLSTLRCEAWPRIESSSEEPSSRRRTERAATCCSELRRRSAAECLSSLFAAPAKRDIASLRARRSSSGGLTSPT